MVFECGHRADVPDSALVVTVEPSQEMNVPTVNGNELMSGDGHPGSCGELERRRLPRHDIPFVIRVGELGNQQLSVCVHDRGLRSCASERAGTSIKEEFDRGERIGVTANTGIGGAQERWQIHQAEECRTSNPRTQTNRGVGTEGRPGASCR